MGMSTAIASLPAERPSYICIIGGPGSGKSTQARQVCEQFDFTHVSTGKLIREGIEKRSFSDWKSVESRMNEGLPIDSEIVAGLVIKYISTLKEKKVVLDNFPMNEENFETWKMMMQNCKFSAIFLLEATEDEMRRRLLARNERPDDVEKAIKERIRTFNYETKPLLEYFINKGMLTVFDGMKKKEVLYEEIKKEIIERKLYV